MKVALLAICSFFSSPDYWLSSYRKNLVCKLESTVETVSNENNIDPDLLAALIYVESGWNKKIVSKANACGLTQVIPKYTKKSISGKRYTCEQLKIPKNSINAGAKILRWWVNYYSNQTKTDDGNSLEKKYTGEEALKRALCSYNAGFRCDRKVPIRAGIRYAEKVQSLKNKIKLHRSER